MTAVTGPDPASAGTDADARALAHLRGADPVLAGAIDAHAGFDPRGWLRELPTMDSFGALIFMVTGQQLSVRSAARILGRIQDLFGGRLPSPAEMLGGRPRRAARHRPVPAEGLDAARGGRPVRRRLAER